MLYDLVIKNGTVVDGSGGPGYRANVAVKGGKIVGVGPAADQAGRTVDAEGLTVAPGFIDAHTHYDCQLVWDPLATSSSWHGITTVVTGNCGFGIAPGRPADRDYLMRLMARVEGIPLEVLQHGLDWEWETFGDYLGRLGRNLGVNVAAQVGHSPLRYYVMGPASYERAATAEELAKMKEVLGDAMAAGAVGFSTSQAEFDVGAYGEPVPSRLSSREELFELAGVMGKLHRGILSQNPNPGGAIISPEFQELMIDLARSTGLPLIWTLLVHRWDMPDEWRNALRFMDRAAASGAKVYALGRCQRMDLEFNLRSTYMFDYCPSWKRVLTTPHEEKKSMLRDPQARAELRDDWDRLVSARPARRADLLHIGQTKLAKNRQLQGRPVLQMAAQQRKHVVDFLLDLSLEEDLETQFVYVGAMNGDPEAVEQIVKSLHCLPGVSDAGAHLDMDCGVDYIGILLGHWVRERGVLSLEEAVRRLTSMSASILGIPDRGLIREGMAADIVIFDPARIRALPREIVRDLPGGGPRIIQRAEGVKAVVVNGEILFEDGKHTGTMPGRVLGSRRSQ